MSYSTKDIEKLVQAKRFHRKIYTDPEIFDLEMERIWGRSWIYIGHESQVPEPGSYVTLNYGKMPVVMVRDKKHEVHVLHNRCGHKGAKLVDKPCGKIGGFRCCYHGWTYRLDGKLLGVPHMAGYEGTGFDKDDPQYSMQKLARYDSHRGFVFATMNPDAPDLLTWMGGAADVMDNLCDRAPEGEVEAAGGILRYVHDCNWKPFLENLNDTMHPMIVHRSVVDAAEDYMKTLPEESTRRDEAEILPPFGQSYEYMEDMGITGFRYGHHYDGGQHSIHKDYTLDPEYKAAMLEAYGEERMHEILSTIIESHSFRLKGAPDSLLHRTLLYSRLINANGSMVGPDDQIAYERIQEGLKSNGSDWIEMHRNFGRDEVLEDRTVGKGTSDLDMRTQYAAWKEYMTAAGA
jgi:phenylpropionate dioxygenase-like ring-hydroxylating dioxygenase large terminal subunit